MKKPTLVAALLLLSHIFVAAQTPAKTAVLALQFETNRSELTEQHRAELDAFLKTLTANPADFAVSVTGHTDARGSDAFNQDLSLRRGQSVAAYLSERGFNCDRITLLAEGEHKPRAGNDSEQGMTLNRRVELRFEHAPVFTNRPTDLVKEMKVRFQAERGITFASPVSGSRVQIPGGILVYPDGSPVRGEVSLHYREWRNLYDYLAFGLPMRYGDRRGDFFFNSSGMFEVQAYQQGQTLAVAPGKEFNVTFVQARQMPEVNLYRFDPQSGSWELAATPGQTPAAQPVILTQQQVEAVNTGMGRPKCTPVALRFPKGVRPAEWLAEAVQTGYDLCAGKRRFPVAFLQDPLQDDSTLVRKAEQTLIQLQQYGDGRSLFFIDDLQQTFTELDLLKNYSWEYVPSLVEGEFTPEHLKIQWTATYLSYDEPNNLYDMQLVSPRLKLEIKTRLRHPDGRIVNREENPALFQQYKTVQKERWDKKLADYTALRRFLALSMPLRPEDEWCMDQVAWLKYFIANKKKMEERYAKYVAADYKTNPDAGNEVIQEFNKRCRAANMAALAASRSYLASDREILSLTLRVSNFGIYNCDQIYRLGEDTQVLAASFRTPDGKPIAARQTNVVEKNAGMMLSTAQPNQVYYSPQKTFDVVVIGQDGRTYFLRATDYAALPLAGRTQAELVLQDVTDQVKTPEDWVKILGI